MPLQVRAFLSELRRRRVYHVAVLYIVVGYAVAQGAQFLFELLEIPNVASQFVAIVVLLGFPLALVLAWAHEETGQAAGFVSGLTHPISGLDHVLAMVAVGFWGAQLGAPAPPDLCPRAAGGAVDRGPPLPEPEW